MVIFDFSCSSLHCPISTFPFCPRLLGRFTSHFCIIGRGLVQVGIYVQISISTIKRFAVLNPQLDAQKSSEQWNIKNNSL